MGNDTGLASQQRRTLERLKAVVVDAERDPVFPKGLTEETWEAVKAFFRREAPGLLERGE